MRVTFNGKTVEVPIDALDSLKEGSHVLVVSCTPEELKRYIEVEQELLDALKAHVEV